MNQVLQQRARLIDILQCEWPTLAVLLVCYAVWLSSLVWHASLGGFWLLPAIMAVTLHSSLQHEMLHGHPSRNPFLNEVLVFPALGLFIPYRRFRYLHLRHHRDKHLTDPFEDPESWYLGNTQWQHTGPINRRLLSINNSLAGRLILGPVLSLWGFCRSDFQLIKQGRRHVALAWFYHLVGVLMVVFVLIQVEIPVWQYVLLVAYPGMSVLMIRTFAEHRAAQNVGHRTAVVEAGWLMSLLFLNNNLHAVHHRHPRVSWFRLPHYWRREKALILEDNGHYHFTGGYLTIARRWLFSQREPVRHPFDK